MQEYVCVAVSLGSEMMWDFHPTQPEVPSFNELMEIHTESDPESHRLILCKNTPCMLAPDGMKKKKTALRAVFE
jgi:hypothetical protein